MKGFISLALLNRLQPMVDAIHATRRLDNSRTIGEELLLDIYEDVKPGVALSPVTEMGILSFAESRWGIKSLDGILLKACAELGEAADEVIKTGEGRSTLEKADMEVGDVQVVLSQYAAKRGTTLDALRAMAYAKCKSRAVHPDLPFAEWPEMKPNPFYDQMVAGGLPVEHPDTGQCPNCDQLHAACNCDIPE